MLHIFCYYTNMDIRSIKTEKKIKMCLLNLLQKKELKDITVAELCRECEFHRKTFYAHYHNTSEIIEELQNEAIDGLVSLLNNVLSGNIDSPEELLKKINDYIIENFDICHLLAKTLLFSEFVKQISEKVSLIISKSIPLTKQSKADKYSFYFLSAGISSLYLKWLINPEQENLQEITNTCILMCEKKFNIGDL